MEQHYVPRVYLKGFTKDNGDCFSLNIEELKKGRHAKPKKSNVKTLCWIKDFYDVLKEYGDTSFQLSEYEKLFVENEINTSYENDFRQVREKFINGEDLNTADVIFLSDFIIHLKLRNPYWLNSFFIANGTTIFNSVFDEIKVELNSHPIYKKFDPELKESIFQVYKNSVVLDPNRDKKAFLFSLIERRKNPHSNQKIRTAFVNANWRMISIPENEDFEFITTDNPGFAQCPTQGIINSKFEGKFVFHFPLTSKHCLELSNGFHDSPSIIKARSIQHWNATNDLVQKINAMSIKHINQRAIAYRRDELLKLSLSDQL